MAFTFDGKLVYEASYIKEKIPSYFAGCSATITKIIDKKSIPEDQYFFASYSKINGWKLLDKDSVYSRKKLLITNKWVDANVPGFGSNNEKLKGDPLPPLLRLEDDEKFIDLDKNEIKMTVRGERDLDKIYFRGTDVGNMLGLVEVRTTIVHVNSAFVKNLHYVNFDTCNQANTTSLYLTYWGLAKLLFASHKEVAMHFQRWAITTLFRAQLGTVEQKQHLVADVLGVSIHSIKSFLNTSVTSMPTVYMFSLGKVKNLRNVFSIPDTFKDSDNIVKYGMTNDLRRRSMEHEKEYGKLISGKGELTLKFHVYIDTFYLNSAETDIGRYFKGAQWDLGHIKYKELACIPDHMISTIVHNEFKRLGTAYGGKLQDIQNELANEKEKTERLQKYVDIQAVKNQEYIEYMKSNHEEFTKEKDMRIKEKDELIREKDEVIKEKNATIALYKLIIEKKLLD